jgi:glutathionyl-hydroquinone reductase
MKLQRTRS